jgi:hypothetical protein
MDIHQVKLVRNVLPILVNTAIQGYEGPAKEERLGILLGRVERNVAIVQEATLYRGGSRSRSGVTVDGESFTRRVRELSKKHDSLFLGTFHSHNEVSGQRSSALTVADRSHFSEDPPHLIELIVLVWHSNNIARPTQRYLQGHQDGCRFRIAGYQMHSPFNLIPIQSDNAAASARSAPNVLHLSTR